MSDTPLISKSDGGLMQSIVLWPVLILVAGVVTFALTVEGSANRSFFYWLVLPPLLLGVLAVYSHLAFF